MTKREQHFPRTGRASLRWKDRDAAAETEAVMGAWMTRLQQDGYRPRTVAMRVQSVRAVSRWCQVDPLELTVEHVRAYLVERDLAVWSRLKYLESIRMFCAFYGLPDATEGIRRPPAPRGVPRPCSRSQLAELLVAAEPTMAAWILLAAGCGLRAFEVAKVSGDDFVSGACGMRLRVEGKAGRVDWVPVPDGVWSAVSPLRRTGRLWSTTSERLRARFRRLSARVGVDVTFHQLRHFFGTETYAATERDLLMTQRLMRHSSPQTTAGYAAVADDRAAAAVARIPLPRAA